MLRLSDAGSAPNRHAIRVGARRCPAAAPFNMVGDAWFAPSGSVLAIAGCTGVGSGFGQNPQPEQYTTELLAAGGDPGLYLATMNGQSTFIGDTGVPVGVLTAN